MEYLSIRFMTFIIVTILSIIMYVVFLIKNEIEYAYCSFGYMFVMSATVLATIVRGAAWLFGY